MKNKKTSSKARGSLLDAAQELMLEKGFVATTLDEICAKAKITKGGFFYYFENKDDLGKVLVNRFCEQMGAQIMERVKCCGDNPRDRVYGFVDAAIEKGQRCESKGCLVGTFTQEISESHPELRKCCERAFLGMRKMFAADLKATKELYAKEADIDIKGLAESFMAIVQGSMLLVKAMRDRSLMTRTLLHFKAYLQQLFGK